MTAEERTERFLTYREEIPMSALESIASLIRDAEDEALERAAEAVEAGADGSNIVGYLQIEHARRIRSLKSGPGVSGKDGP